MHGCRVVYPTVRQRLRTELFLLKVTFNKFKYTLAQPQINRDSINKAIYSSPLPAPAKPFTTKTATKSAAQTIITMIRGRLFSFMVFKIAVRPARSPPSLPLSPSAAVQSLNPKPAGVYIMLCSRAQRGSPAPSSQPVI